MSKDIVPGFDQFALNEDGSIAIPFLGGGGFNDYTIAADSLPLAHATAPTSKVFRGGIFLPAFTGTGGNLKEVFASVHIQHDYLPGTKVFPHIHWSHIIESPSGDVKWSFEYSVITGFSSGVFPASTTVSVTETAGTQYAHQISEVSEGDAIPSTNLEPDSVVVIRLFRDPTDGSDTFENDAFLINVDLHYQSRLTYTNEKVRPFTPYLQV